jgi:hypothetical protein
MQSAIVIEKHEARILVLALEHLESWCETSMDDTEQSVYDEFKAKLQRISE